MPILRHVYDSATGTYVDVEVTQDVYDFYRRNAWAIRRNNTRFYAHEIQFSSLIGGEGESIDHFLEFITDVYNPLHILCNMDVAIQIKAAFCRLPLDDQQLLYYLFVEEYSERWYGRRMDLPQKTVHNRKCRALRRLEYLLNDSNT